MGKKISQDIIEQIPVLYEKLDKNKSAVARELNITVGTVTKYLNIYESTPVEVVKKRVKVDDELIEKINALYKIHKNMKLVAQELGISPTTVKNYLTDENLKLKEKVNDDRDALWYYIFRLFGQESETEPVSKWNITQMTKFNRMGINYRAQLLTLKYFYEIKKNPIKKEYRTIGIIPYVVDDAALYYKTQEKRQREIEEAIEKQLEQDRIEIKYNPSDYIGKKKKKNLIDLDSVVSDTND